MLVKICGITRLEDARFAVECGARALGFVFWPESPRSIDPDHAGAIVSTLPPFVTPVGVFVNQAIEYVNGVAALARLGAVQLHGDETAAYAGAMTRPVIKAVGVAGTDEEIDGWPPGTLLLLDVHDPVRRGGTGRTLDWAQASAIAQRRRVVLAGGLTPDNVAEAISRVRPYGIDVSSGVEVAPGVKDHQRLERLFEVVRAVAEEADSPQGTRWTRG